MEKSFEKNPSACEISHSGEPPEASPELFQEMIDQLPILREMLREAEEELSGLKGKPDASDEKIRELRDQINGLREEISNREDLIT